jgi:hypothetical protein
LSSVSRTGSCYAPAPSGMSPWRCTPCPPGETELDRQRGPQGQQLLVWEAGYEKGGQPFTVAVAEDLNPILQVLRRLLWTGLLLSLLAAVLLLLVQRWLLRRGFRRIDTVR